MRLLKLVLLMLLLQAKQVSYGQSDQELKLVQALLNLNSAISNQDSDTKATLSKAFEGRLIQALEQEDIVRFKTFGRVLDSLNSAFSFKKSGEYELFTLRNNFEHWNYVLKNKQVIHKQERTFDYFYAVYSLDQHRYLLIKRMDELSFSCYKAHLYEDNSGLIDSNNHFLSVCSWTNVDESLLQNIPSPESDQLHKDHLKSYAPIPIKFDAKNKEISYSFYRQSDGKKITRKARYLHGGFVIKSYDARMFEE
ncbi:MULTISPECIES: hypothetical protein [Sphingobacterium]|uniref:hypothetical protein n=1 Tax=Sphingobacterium TaxID=28453 RepID=UPI00257E6CE3|nr:MULTISPECIES: hypothetical protein [Sphingobacterium]